MPTTYRPRPGSLTVQLVTDRLQPGRIGDRGEGVVHRGEGDPGPRSLVLGPVVIVDAQLGVVREVGAELDEERTEVGVHTVEVEVVDQPCSPHDPRVGIAGGIAAFFRAEQRCLLLRPADEHHPLGCGERSEPIEHHVVLALAPAEIDPLDALIVGVAVHHRGEPIGDLRQRRGRGDRQAQLPVHVADQAPGVLQLRLIHVQIHPVDALGLERHMLRQHFGDGAGYRHHRLRSGNRRPAGPPTAQPVHTPATARCHRSPCPAGAPNTQARTHASSGWAKPH